MRIQKKSEEKKKRKTIYTRTHTNTGGKTSTCMNGNRCLLLARNSFIMCNARIRVDDVENKYNIILLEPKRVSGGKNPVEIRAGSEVSKPAQWQRRRRREII